MRISKNTITTRKILLSGVAAVAVLLSGSALIDGKAPLFGTNSAYAQGGGGGGGGGGSSGGSGSSGGGSSSSSDGHSSSDHDSDHEEHEDGERGPSGSGEPQNRAGQSNSGSGNSGSSGGNSSSGSGGSSGGGSSSGGSGGSSGGGNDSGGGSDSGNSNQGGSNSGGGQGGQPPAAASERPTDVGGKPDGAGNKPEDVGGGKPTTPGGPPSGVGEGDDYGDLWVVLRYDDGRPIYISYVNEHGDTVYVPQPIDINGVPIPLDEEGAPLLVLRDPDTLELILSDDEEYRAVYTYVDANGVSQEITVTYVDEDGEEVKTAEEAATDEGESEYSAVQEVDLGRTNISRAPLTTPSPRADSALENALSEALDKIAAADGIEYDEAGRIIVVKDGLEATIDSPLENLALYKLILDSDVIPGVTLPVDGTWLDLAASLLGAASDKEEPLDVDEIAYLNIFLEISGDLTDDDSKIYYDYSDFEYTRSSAFDGIEVSWLEQIDTEPPTYVLRTASVLEAVFDNTDVSASNIDGFTTAADDARAVIEFVHSHPVPTAE